MNSYILTRFTFICGQYRNVRFRKNCSHQKWGSVCLGSVGLLNRIKCLIFCGQKPDKRQQTAPSFLAHFYSRFVKGNFATKLNLPSHHCYETERAEEQSWIVGFKCGFFSISKRASLKITRGFRQGSRGFGKVGLDCPKKWMRRQTNVGKVCRTAFRTLAEWQ